MARTYRTSPGTRMINSGFQAMIRLGLGKEYRYILTVRGRRTGKPYSTPVDIMQRDGQRWLVAAYGVTNWVRNARAAGQVTLSRGRRSETLPVAELGPEDSISVLRQYLREVPVTQPYFDATPDSPDQQIAAEAPRHPVFVLLPRGDGEPEENSMPTTEQTRRGMTLRSLGPFFALTFGLTWGIAALLILFQDQIEAIFGELSYTHPLFILAVYSPGFAGVFLIWRHYGVKGLGSYPFPFSPLVRPAASIGHRTVHRAHRGARLARRGTASAPAPVRAALGARRASSGTA
jgi:deazaflavin-dependent oxidoreductase (nitroreductase family)